MGTHGLMGYLLMRAVAQLNSVFNILIFSAEDGESRDQKDGGEKAGELFIYSVSPLCDSR